MPTGSSPGQDIFNIIAHNIGPIVLIIFAIIGSIGRAMKSSARPPSGTFGSTPTSMSPPTTMPHSTSASSPAASPSQAAPPRPTAQSKFRPQGSPARQTAPAQGSSAQQLAEERADIERFVKEEKEMEAGEPEALGVPLTSSAAAASASNSLFAAGGPGSGVNGNLLRAIMLAQALGPPRAKSGRGRDSTA